MSSVVVIIFPWMGQHYQLICVYEYIWVGSRRNPRPWGYKQLQKIHPRCYLTPFLYLDIVNNIVLYYIYRTNPKKEGDILLKMFVCIQIINFMVYVRVICSIVLIISVQL